MAHDDDEIDGFDRPSDDERTAVVHLGDYIYEYGNGTSELIDVDVYESGGNTMLFADFRTHSGAEETWYVTVLCIHEDLVRYN